jgi:hypothetical protein
MMMRNPNDTHETRATGAMMTAKDATLVPKCLAQMCFQQNQPQHLAGGLIPRMRSGRSE